jgi:hypothetical protein
MAEGTAATLALALVRRAKARALRRRAGIAVIRFIARHLRRRG